eukprot:COSAG03_NODE_990_length_5091_cov_465.421474_2_plen_68_part_00
MPEEPMNKAPPRQSLHTVQCCTVCSCCTLRAPVAINAIIWLLSPHQVDFACEIDNYLSIRSTQRAVQ